MISANRYDSDHDGHLSHDEFRDFLIDIGRSKVLGVEHRMDASASAAVVASDAAAGSKASAAAAVKQIDAKATAAVAPALAIQVVPAVVEPALVVPTAAAAVIPQKRGMCPELSKELVASFAKDNTIMLAVCDWRMFETFGGCDKWTGLPRGRV